MNISSVSDRYSSNNVNKMTFNATPIPKNIADNIKWTLLNKSVKKVDLYCHRSPDEDTVNSMKVMYHWLKKHGKHVAACLNPSDTWGLRFNRLFYRIKNGNDRTAPDKALCIDFNGFERIPENYGMSILLNDNNNIMGFDHHSITNTTIKSPDIYIDEKAYSCSGVIFRFFEAIGEKLSKKDLKNLFCGMISDYKGSKLINIQKTENGYQLTKTKLLTDDKNSDDVFEKISQKLSTNDKNKIYKHLDIMSRLSTNEKKFMKDIISDITVSSSKNFAYIFIDPNSESWASVGMDNIRTSAILKEIRMKLVDDVKNSDLFDENQKERFKDIKAAGIFYRTNPSVDSHFQASIHSKNGYAEQLMNYIKENLNPNLIGGGHPDRVGSRIKSIKYDDILQFVNNFLTADEQLSKSINKTL